MKAKLIEAKGVVNQKRIDIKAIKDEFKKFGDESTPVIPNDIEVMYLAKLCDNSLRNDIRNQNALAGYKKAYKDEIDPHTMERLVFYQKQYASDFDTAKARLETVMSFHPLYQVLKDIKGLSPYQLGMIMMFVKKPERFATPSKLMVYSGLAAIDGKPVNKANLPFHKEYYQNQGKLNDNRLTFGFNTKFSGRLYVLGDCLIKSGGYFYNQYVKIRERLEQRCINGGECFTMTAEEAKLINKQVEKELEQIEKSGDDGFIVEEQKPQKVKVGELYMKGKKNQSLKMFTHVNAKKRILRTLLHTIYYQWMKIKGIEARNIFAVDYLGHNLFITLEDILAYDQNNHRTNKKKEVGTEKEN
jgi:hypothetical protein